MKSISEFLRVVRAIKIIGSIFVLMVICACLTYIGMGVFKDRNFIVDDAPSGEPIGSDVYMYDGRIEHIFTHELIFDTDKAFASDNKLRDCFDKDHLTAKEFKALLSQLYQNNYVLISLDQALGGKVELPEGKLPLVMSFDDMTYDTHGKGCVDKLVLKGGLIYDYTEGVQSEFSRERENVTILESFIADHPDFSCNGGRATLCVNGYNGILGYRVTPDCKVPETRIADDTAECKKVVEALKALGYTFASHTYYHRYFNSSSAKMLENDCVAWEKYIAPIVGRTNVLCYPAGEHNAEAQKNGVFKRHGYDVFLCVGSFDGTEYERSCTDVRYIYRRPFDGTALRLYGELYAHLADTKEIYDSARFRPFSFKGFYH